MVKYQYVEMVTAKNYEGAKNIIAKRYSNLRKDFKGYEIISRKMLNVTPRGKTYAVVVKLIKK